MLAGPGRDVGTLMVNNNLFTIDTNTVWFLSDLCMYVGDLLRPAVVR